MNNFFKQKNKGGGFTLVETLISISIFSFSILALMAILGTGVSDINYAKKKITASYLAQEGIEYIRNMRDDYVLYPVNGTWNEFKTRLNACRLNNNGCGIDIAFPTTNNSFIFQCSASHKCDLYINDGSYSTDPSGTSSGFIRIIRMDTSGLGQDEIRIYSEVTWIQGSGTFNVTLTENLFNWTAQ